MKTYAQFNEAISAARLAQLAAKGKGGAASAKMKADGLKSSATKVSSVKPKPKALPGSKGGALALNKPTPKVADKGGSIVKRSSAGTQVVKKEPGGALTKKTFKKPEKKPGKGFMTSPDGPGGRTPKDWGKKTSEWEGDTSKTDTPKSKKKGKRLGLPKVKNPLKRKTDDKGSLGTADERVLDGKDLENSQI